MDIAYVVKDAKKRRNPARTGSVDAGYYSILLENAWEEAAADAADSKPQSQNYPACDETLFEFS